MCSEATTMTSQAQLTHVANVEDDSTGEAFEVFQFVKVGGRRGRLLLEREIADDVKQVRAKLRKFNAALSPNRQQSISEVEAAIRTQPSRLFRYAASNGWLPDTSGFVTTCETIDSKNRPQKILPPRRLNDALRRGAKPEGSLEGWKKEVATPAGYSDLAVTRLSAAFAAPLLKVANRNSFGLNTYGLSKTGKSTILVAASSVGGAGSESELTNWAATSAAVGEFCRLYCDRLMPINEVGLIGKKNAYAKIQPTIYQVAEGRDRDRHSRSSFATTDDSAYHRTIFGSTSEHSFDDYARLAGEARDEGELARCIEIPAVRNARATVIDRFPTCVLPESRKTWARSTLKRLRKACVRHHGVALRPFVEFLMSDLQRAKRRVEAYMAEFMEEVDTRRLTGAMEHAAENCALIYAGGCTAVDAGILPYLKKDVMRAITRCCRDALQAANEVSDPLLRAKRVLRGNLESGLVFTRKSSKDRFDTRTYHGYVTQGGPRSTYVIRAASLREWFKTEPGALRGIIAWLVKKGCLLARQSRTTKTHDRPTDWAERIVAWPGRRPTPVRSISFYDPFVR
jgi:putative DNA primase/helicase